jgi:hypothetical protein
MQIWPMIVLVFSKKAASNTSFQSYGMLTFIRDGGPQTLSVLTGYRHLFCVSLYFWLAIVDCYKRAVATTIQEEFHHKIWTGNMRQFSRIKAGL